MEKSLNKKNMSFVPFAHPLTGTNCQILHVFFNKVYLEEPYFCSVWDRSAENCFEDPDHILSSDGVEHVFLRQFLRVQHAGMILRVQHPLALNKGY